MYNSHLPGCRNTLHKEKMLPGIGAVKDKHAEQRGYEKDRSTKGLQVAPWRTEKNITTAQLCIRMQGILLPFPFPFRKVLPVAVCAGGDVGWGKPPKQTNKQTRKPGKSAVLEAPCGGKRVAAVDRSQSCNIPEILVNCGRIP